MDSSAKNRFERALELFHESNYLAAINLWEELEEEGYDNPNLDVYLHAARLERSKILQYVECTSSDLEALALSWSAQPRNGSLTGHVTAARDHLKSRRYEEAALELKQALLTREEDSTLHLALARVYCILGRAKNAVLHAERARALGPDQPEPCSTLGQILLEIDQHKESEASFLRAIEIDPAHERSWYGLAALYYTQKRLGLSEECVKKALSIAPSSLTSLAFLDEIRAELENNENLILEAQKVIEAHPQWADWHLKLGNLHSQAGRVEDALKCYERALQVNPQFVKCRCERAGLYLKEGRFREALDDLKAVQNEFPDRDEGALVRAATLEANGVLGEAAYEYWSALKVSPDYANRHIELGKKFFIEGLYEQAARELSFGLSLRPDYADGHYFLGLVNAKAGRHAQAIDSFLEALKLNPHYLLASIALVEVYFASGQKDLAKRTILESVRPLVTTDEDRARLAELEARVG